MRCPDDQQLCPDGSCDGFCSPNLISPCENDCALVACTKIIASFDSCMTDFAAWYELGCSDESTPGDESDEYDLSWFDPGFLLAYLWVITNSLGIVAWSWFNHRLFPVEESFKFHRDEGFDENQTETKQVGYRRHRVGVVLHAMSLVTLFGWFPILAIIFNRIHLSESDSTDLMLLEAFLVTVTCGFVWCCILYWPHSIEAIFLCRCNLPDATFVAVYYKKYDSTSSTGSEGDLTYQGTMGTVSNLFTICMVLIYANEDLHVSGEDCKLEYCPVRVNTDGSRYIVFLFRRYNYSDRVHLFIPGQWSIGKRLSDFVPRGVNLMDKMEMEYQKAVQSTRSANVLYRITHVSGTSRILREGKIVLVQQDALVPGDIVNITPGIIHADMILLTGEVVLDESALTGEATPQAKTPIDPTCHEQYDTKLHKKHTLNAGTSVQECHNALAIVKHTGSYTQKGELSREVIAFRGHKLQYELDLPEAITLLALYSFVITMVVVVKSDAGPVMAWVLGLGIWTNAFPPLLPIAFVIPVGYAFERLSKARVACSNSDSILLAGKIRRAFFDKTGTLTEQGLEYDSCRSSKSWNYGSWESSTLSLAMAACHSLVKSSNGTMIGHPVDRAMFKASSAKLGRASGSTASIKTKTGEKLKVARRFDFDHNRMTQSVVIQHSDGPLTVLVKGSGESVAKLCNTEELPTNFFEELKQKSKSGVYQIAVASKLLAKETDMVDLNRDQVESDLTFEGVLNFRNRMRRSTPDVIKQLNGAGVQSAMVTGDSIWTGIHIARECGFIEKSKKVAIGQLDQDGDIGWYDEHGQERRGPCIEEGTGEISDGSDLVMSGEAWQELLAIAPNDAIKLVPFIRVFGRCSRHDKVSVVDTFSDLGFKTLFCGDGGNDCGALKAAHVGVALSDTDASVVAPFTSLDKDIASVLAVLREERSSLASMLSVYKFIVLYGNISSYCQVIMYSLQASFSGWMWLFVDGFYTICFSLTLPLSRPATQLSPSRPTSSLLSWATVSSVAGIALINYIYIAVTFFVLNQEDWYQCRKWDADSIITGSILSASDNYEMSVTFLLVGTQVLAAAAAMNFGYEFRQAWYRNTFFVLFFLGFTAMIVYAVLVPSPLSCIWRINCVNEWVHRGVSAPDPLPIGNPFNTTIMPQDFRWKLFGLMMANFFAVISFEYAVVNGIRRYSQANKYNEQDETLEGKKNEQGQVYPREEALPKESRRRPRDLQKKRQAFVHLWPAP